MWISSAGLSPSSSVWPSLARWAFQIVTYTVRRTTCTLKDGLSSLFSSPPSTVGCSHTFTRQHLAGGNSEGFLWRIKSPICCSSCFNTMLHSFIFFSFDTGCLRVRASQRRGYSRTKQQFITGPQRKTNNHLLSLSPIDNLESPNCTFIDVVGLKEEVKVSSENLQPFTLSSIQLDWSLKYDNRTRLCVSPSSGLTKHTYCPVQGE